MTEQADLVFTHTKTHTDVQHVLYNPIIYDLRRIQQMTPDICSTSTERASNLRR